MNLFVCLVHYTATPSEVESILGEHREYLSKGYKSGFLLVSGPQEPRDGGVIIGKFKSKGAAIEFSKNDPFVLKNVAKYEIIEFNPVLRSELIEGF